MKKKIDIEINLNIILGYLYIAASFAWMVLTFVAKDYEFLYCVQSLANGAIAVLFLRDGKRE